LLPNDIAFDIGKPEVTAGVSVRQMLVVQAQRVQPRGVQVVNVDFDFGRAVAVVVGRAVTEAAFHAAAGEPHGEAFGVVVATWS
jgi:hypothetical protein